MAPKIQRASDLGVGAVKVLVHGHPGSGKTSFAATAPSPLFLLTEPNGVESIRSVNPDAGVIMINEPDDLRGAIKWLHDTKDHGYQTVVLDSLTDLQGQIQRDVMSRSGNINPSVQEWGVIIDHTAAIARTVRNLPMDSIVICLSQEVAAETEGVVYVRPAVTGKKLPNVIAAMFSIVAHTFKRPDKEGLEFQLLLESGEKYTTKGHRALGKYEPPDFAEWKNRINAYHEARARGEVPIKPNAPEPAGEQSAQRRRRRSA